MHEVKTLTAFSRVIDGIFLHNGYLTGSKPCKSRLYSEVYFKINLQHFKKL